MAASQHGQNGVRLPVRAGLSAWSKPFGTALGEGDFGLRILATTDLHANLTGYDYFRDMPSDRIGLLRLAGLIAAARAGAATTLLLDNGDLLQGSPLGDLHADPGHLSTGTPHPMIAAMNSLGYDAATLGNHDFDFGLPILDRSLTHAAFPFVLANVMRTDGMSLLPPFVILDRAVSDASGNIRPIRVGITGLVPPQIMRWNHSLLAGRVTASDAIAAADDAARRMRTAGADIVIALNHTGIDGADPHPGMEDSAIPVAAVPGIDVHILGHSHLVFPFSGDHPHPAVDPRRGTIHGKPAVMAGALGSHLGIIDLHLRHDGRRWSVCAHRTRAVSAPARPAKSLPVAYDAAPAHTATLAYIRRPTGHSTAPLNSYFSLLMFDRGLKLLADAQRTAAARFLHGSGQAAGIPILSAVAPLKSGGRAGPDHYSDIPAGSLLLRHCADLYPFPNFIRALLIDGAALAEWLERAAAMFLQVTPGLADQPLRNPDHPSYNFDMIDGVTWRIDLSQPARYGPGGGLRAPRARRITDLCHLGRPVNPADPFVIVTNSYRAQGGGGFPGLDRAKVVMDGSITSRDVLMHYLAQQSPVSPQPDRIWRFRPLPGTSVIFDTGPGAMQHLGDTAHLDLHPLGLTKEGYARFRLLLGETTV